MGKYMKKSKITGEVAVMEVSLSPQCSLGVRTRAKTLALQRQQQQKKSPTSAQNQVDSSAFSYLELRSRRLEKPPLLSEAKKQNQNHENQVSPRTRGCCGENPRPNFRWHNSRLRVRSLDSGLVDEGLALKGDETEVGNNLGLEEASFGEKNSEFEGRDRSARESTPCSLIIRESDTLKIPGSTTRRPTSTATNQRVGNAMQRITPTAHEIEEFFAFAEQQQQRIFIEKYNFDIKNDKPLPGRYEWVRIFP
ncbi:cyclin-dependent kinase inhibitor 3-like [Humulus lupulus]|uniref:cyclin-dependent kinase inhibitor 3-like n=1 Tax=Humulus lupulus TaxID=3486 RepID=UPI002B409B90|nr:cyclin-dependent kinase inhibitor 3-like [Humulus lupulus]